MADITELFGPRKGGINPQNMHGQRGQQMNINIDINSLPDMPCIYCGGLEFTPFVRIKKLSKTVSPSGQEGSVNVSQLRCSNPNCKWVFNPKEWNEHDKKENDEAIDTIVDVLSADNKEGKPEEYNKELCRKCGQFYEKGIEHLCNKVGFTDTVNVSKSNEKESE